MFKQDRREIFSFRKFKDGRTDSALIGATILALGLGLVTTTQTVSADVVNGAGGSEVVLIRQHRLIKTHLQMIQTRLKC